jgi:hypothetical protein
MNYIKTSLVILFFPSLLFAQNNLVNDGVSLVIEAKTDVLLEESGVTNKNGGEISNAGAIHLEKNWTETDISTYSGNGWMWFDGNINQKLSTASTIPISNLKVNNGQKLILESGIKVSKNLDLSANGKIELGTNNLVITSGGSINNYDVNAYIISNGTGYLQQEVSTSNVIFPIGNSFYNPATLNNTGTTDQFQIRVEDVVYNNGTSGLVKTTNLVNTTWYVSEQNIGGSNASLTTQWNKQQELTNFDQANSALLHWNGHQWTSSNNSVAATANGSYWTQTRSGLTSFSPFTVQSFTNTEVQLLDENIATSVKLFPNPSQEYISLDFINTTPQQANIQILAMDGKLLVQKIVSTSNLVTLKEVADFSAGTYLVHILYGDGSYTITKFIKSTL